MAGRDHNRSSYRFIDMLRLIPDLALLPSSGTVVDADSSQQLA